MEYNQMAKKVIDFQRISFENWYNSVSLLQDQAASSMNMILDQTRWVQEDGRQPLQNWINLFQQERDRFKNYVAQGFDDFEKFVTESVAEGRQAVSKVRKQAEKQQATN